MANPTQLGPITGGGGGTKRALEAMRCAVELDGGQEARGLEQALSRCRCVSNVCEPRPSLESHVKCITLLMEALLGLGDQGGSLGIKTTEFSQKSEPRKVWPLDLVCVRSMVALVLPERWIQPPPQ